MKPVRPDDKLVYEAQGGATNEPVRFRRKLFSPVFKMAVLAGVKATVEFHIRRGEDVNAGDEKGRSPLLLAASKGHVEICRLLLAAGADPALRDREGNDAFSIASAKGQAAVAELLGRLSAPTETPGPRSGGLITQTRFVDLSYVSAPLDEVSTQPALVGPKLQDSSDAAAWGTWEEESEVLTPPSDTSCVVAACSLQYKLSQHMPENTDENWDDIDLSLPEVYASRGRWARHEEDPEWALKTLIVSAILDGRVAEWCIGDVAPRSEEDEALPDAEFIANLKLMLGDLGVIVDDSPPEPDIPARAKYVDEDEDRYHTVVSEALGFLHRLNSNDTEPLSLYVRGLPKGLLTREDEVGLGRDMAEGMQEAWVAVASSPAAVAELGVVLDGLALGESALEEIIETDAIDESSPDGHVEGEDDRNPDGEPRGSERPAARTVPQELLSHINAARTLCRRLSAPDSPLQRLTLASELGRYLAALKPSPVLIAKLRCIIEGDPLGGAARQIMDAGLEKERKARERLTEANLKLVLWVAKRYGGLPLPDRIQEGNLGLLKAAKRFDYRRGTRFSTYATWWIRQSIARASADTSRLIRLPVHRVDQLRKAQKAQKSYINQTGREATPEELSVLIGLPLEKTWQLLATEKEPVSIETEEGWSEVESIIDRHIPSPEESVASISMQVAVRNLVNQLPPKEATVIRMRFGIGGDEHTLEEVGMHFGFTRERARQIEAKALGKLMHPERLKSVEGLL